MIALQAPTFQRPRSDELLRGALDNAARGLLASAGDGRTFREWVADANPTYRWHRWNEEVGEVLQAVIDGELGRVMVFAPPRQGKSQLISRLFPARYLSIYPERWVGLVSYGAEHAYPLSRAAREHYVRAGGVLSGDATAVKQWETTEGGGLWAAGVGGPLVGRGFHLGILDDPIKDEEAAQSAEQRKKQADWYDSTWATRREPAAAEVITVTRWHQHDLAGHLLEQARDTGEEWYVVRYPATYDPHDEVDDLPASCTLRPDFRTKTGEALCPERYDQKALGRIRATSTSYTWSALYQQRPVAREGNRFKRDWFNRRVQAPPVGPHVLRCRAWDEAASQDAGDWTVGALLYRDTRRATYGIEHIARARKSSGQRDAMIRATAEMDAARYGIGTVLQKGQQEPGSSGKDRLREFYRILDGHWIADAPATGSKELRAEPYASQIEMGNVEIVDDGSWDMRAFIEEHLAFPAGTHDDQVDAASDAYNTLAVMPAPKPPSNFVSYNR